MLDCVHIVNNRDEHVDKRRHVRGDIFQPAT